MRALLPASATSFPCRSSCFFIRRPYQLHRPSRILNAVSEDESSPTKNDTEIENPVTADTITDTVQESPKKITRNVRNQEEAGSAAGLFYGGLFEKGMDPRLFGENVDPDVPLPQEYENDIWENPKFEVQSLECTRLCSFVQILGTLMQYFVPALVVGGLIVGGIAAKSFNDGATSYLQP